MDLLVKLIEKAAEERTKAEAKAQWVALYPHMALERLKYISFPDYYAKVTGKDIDRRSDEEILKEVAEIRKTLGGQQ